MSSDPHAIELKIYVNNARELLLVVWMGGEEVLINCQILPKNADFLKKQSQQSFETPKDPFWLCHRQPKSVKTVYTRKALLMLQNYLLLALRQMMKNRLFIFINIFGMAVAIACCVVAYFLHDFNATFDGHHVKAPSIYRISSIRDFQNKLTKYGHAPLGLGSALQANPGEIEKIVRYSSQEIDTRVDQLIFNDVVVYTDPTFFELFSFEPLHGTLSLSEKSSIVISEDLAIKYFGSNEAVGKEILQLLDSGKTKPYTVSGVFKRQPKNTSFTHQAYIRFDNIGASDPTFDENDWESRTLLYAQISNINRVKQIEEDLQKFIKNNNEVREDFILKSFNLESFVGLAKDDSYNNTRGIWTNSAAHISAVIGTAAMGIFILLIACFNLTNTAIAVSSRRLKEIGVRKVLGSGKLNIITQYISEVFFICFIALILGLLIAKYYLIPAFNSLWSFWSISPDYFAKPEFILFGILILFVTSLLAGSYPAFYISKFQPVEILKGKVKFGGTNGFTLTLLTLQLIISLTAIVCSMAFIANAKYQQELDMGFNKNEVIYTSVANTLEFEALKSSLQRLPDVASIASSSNHIGSSYFNDPIKSGEKELEVDILDIGDDYLKTVGITLVDGRDFISNSETDKLESIIVTENMATEFGWSNPVGQEIIWMDTVRYHVVGVVKNVVNKGFMNRMDPVMFRYRGNENTQFCLVKAPINKIASIKSTMEEETKKLFPERLNTVHYMNELIVNSIQVNNNILKMFIFLGVLAMLLSATGLYTLTSLNVIKRMKEIGMRKVLGASAVNITRIINKEFFIILSVALVTGGYFGSTLASILMDSIWEHFERTTLITVFYSVIIMVIISFLSIGYKVYSTLRINPTMILRSE